MKPYNILKFPSPEKEQPPTDISIFKKSDLQHPEALLIAYHDYYGNINSENVIKFVGEFYGCNFRQISWTSGNGHNDILVER